MSSSAAFAAADSMTANSFPYAPSGYVPTHPLLALNLGDLLARAAYYNPYQSLPAQTFSPLPKTAVSPAASPAVQGLSKSSLADLHWDKDGNIFGPDGAKYSFHDVVALHNQGQWPPAATVQEIKQPAQPVESVPILFGQDALAPRTPLIPLPVSLQTKIDPEPAAPKPTEKEGYEEAYEDDYEEEEEEFIETTPVAPLSSLSSPPRPPKIDRSLPKCLRPDCTELRHIDRRTKIMYDFCIGCHKAMNNNTKFRCGEGGCFMFTPNNKPGFCAYHAYTKKAREEQKQHGSPCANKSWEHTDRPYFDPNKELQRPYCVPCHKLLIERPPAYVRCSGDVGESQCYNIVEIPEDAEADSKGRFYLYCESCEENLPSCATDGCTNKNVHVASGFCYDCIRAYHEEKDREQREKYDRQCARPCATKNCKNKVGVPKLRITHCADCLSGNIYEVIPCKYPGCRTGRHPEHHECDKKLEDEKREAERRKAEEESYELGADVDDDGSVSD